MQPPPFLDTVRQAAQREIGALFARTRVHAFEGETALRHLGDTPPLGTDGNRYDLHIYPAIANVDLAPGGKVEFAFVVFSPTGEIKERRDLLRASGAENTAFVEMCTDLAPFIPEVGAIVAELEEAIGQFWPHRAFAFTMMATSEELEVVAVFLDVGSFAEVAAEIGRRVGV